MGRLSGSVGSPGARAEEGTNRLKLKEPHSQWRARELKKRLEFKNSSF